MSNEIKINKIKARYEDGSEQEIKLQIPISSVIGLESKLSSGGNGNSNLLFNDYQEMVAMLETDSTYSQGSSIYIRGNNTPEAWIVSVDLENKAEELVDLTNENIIKIIESQGKIGYYVLSFIEATANSVNSEKIATEKYVEENFLKKLTEAQYGQLAVIQFGGSLNGIDFSSNPSDNFSGIPQYNNGRLKVKTPTSDSECANKKYVDDAVAGKRSYLGTVSGWTELNNNVKAGDYYRASAEFNYDTTGTEKVHIGDFLIAIVDNPTEKSSSCWDVLHMELDTNTWTANSKIADGYVEKGQGNPNKVWATDSDGVPAWRESQAAATNNMYLDEDGYLHIVINN